MNLVGEILREPTFPADEFDALKRQYLTRLEGQTKEPEAIAPLIRRAAFAELSQGRCALRDDD